VFFETKTNRFIRRTDTRFLRTDISTMSKKDIGTSRFFQKFFGGITIACGDSEFEMAKHLGKSEMIRNGIDISAIETIHKP
jgi:hypothetical protein